MKLKRENSLVFKIKSFRKYRKFNAKIINTKIF